MITKPPSDELRVSCQNTVYHNEMGVLCQVETNWDVALFLPVTFKDKLAAHKWIESGCIAEVQEGLMNLKVGFSNVMVKKTRDLLGQRIMFDD